MTVATRLLHVMFVQIQAESAEKLYYDARGSLPNLLAEGRVTAGQYNRTSPLLFSPVRAFLQQTISKTDLERHIRSLSFAADFDRLFFSKNRYVSEYDSFLAKVIPPSIGDGTPLGRRL